MKLARPDVFHPRIVLAGDPPAPGEGDGRADDAGLLDALRRRGLHARSLAWDDPETLHADLVILRAVHGIGAGVGAAGGAGGTEFLAWTRRVRNLVNAPEVIAWNVDPRYLRDLRYAEVPTLTGEPPDAMTALIFFGGGRSHAFGVDAAGAVREPVAEPEFEVWDLGRAALRAAAERLSIRIDELLYARADVAGAVGDARLASLDLVAPRLGWRELAAADRAAGERRFARCVETALERLGLGPLSHRRP